jgi:hypothetical protein
MVLSSLYDMCILLVMLPDRIVLASPDGKWRYEFRRKP